MKSRTSFFEKTVLKKDLTRFFPLWALYLIGGLLMMHVLSGFYGSYFDNRGYSIARDLNAMTGPLGILSACYGFLAAQLLFGDLHSTRLCYGVHALPLRREDWYLTHTVSGLLMGLVPPLVILLTLMPLMGKFWFTALLCWSGMALHYLFFFGLSVLCMMCTGHRFAATAVFGILNFLALIINWFAKTIYIPLLPGVRANTGIFDLFCPVVELMGRDEFFLVQHLDTCPCHTTTYIDGMKLEILGNTPSHEYGFTGIGSDWGYLWVLAGVGIVLLALGLVLYRRRNLERAGDFMAFRPMKPIFLTVYTLCVGGVLFYLGYETADTFAGYVFFAIGLFVGYFTGKMLLERTIRVFKGRSWAGLGILYAAVALSLLLTWLDPIGIARRVPDSQRVQEVYLYDGYLSDYQLNKGDLLANRSDVLVITEPEDIAAICQIHPLMIEENKAISDQEGRRFTLQYKMKNGTTISRTYRIGSYGEVWEALTPYLTKPAYLFGVNTLEELQKQAYQIHFSEYGEIPKSLWPALLEAIWLDAQEGYISTNNGALSGHDRMYIELRVGNQYRGLFFSEHAPHLQQWWEQFKSSPEYLFGVTTPEELINTTASICIYGLYEQVWTMPLSHYDEFLTLLWQDCRYGKVQVGHKQQLDGGLYLEMECRQSWFSLTLASDSQSAQMLRQIYATTSRP